MRALPALALLVASLGLGPAEPARAAGGPPVLVADVLRLAQAGAGESLLLNLIADRGVLPPVSVDDVVALKEAGVSDAVVSAVLLAARQDGAGVTYRVENGVLVVEGRGEPDPPGEGQRGDEAGEAWSPPPPPPPSETVVAAAAPLPAESENPYPFGAVFGVSGGAVFLPARFGDPPSAFGRTVVVPGPYTLSLGCAGPCFLPAPVGVVPPPSGPGTFSLQNGHGTGRTIGIRTSRGVRQVPN